MKQADFSPQFPTVWGTQADTTHIQFPVPASSSDAGRASLTLGFPPANFSAPEAGGTFMYGQDLNGSLRMLSTSAQNYESGVVAPFSSSFAASIGGYPSGAVVADGGTPGVYWRSTADNNITVPGASGAAWVNLFSGLLATAGEAQSSSAATTFTNGLSIATDQVSGNQNQYSPPLVLQSNGLGRVLNFYANINGTPQVATELYTGTTRIAYSALNADGSITTNKGNVAFQADYLRNSGATQASSAPTTFSKGLYTALGVSSWDIKNTQALTAGDAWNTFVHFQGADQTISSRTTFSNAVTIPLGVSSWDIKNTQALSVGDAVSSFARLGGDLQTISAPTFFKNGLSANTLNAPPGTTSPIAVTSDLRLGTKGVYANSFGPDGTSGFTVAGDASATGTWTFKIAPSGPLGIASTAITNTNLLTVGDAFKTFVRLGGNAQTVSAPTTFTTAITAAVDQASGASSQYSPNLVLQSNGLGKVQQFYANINGAPQAATELYSGANRIAYSALNADGSVTTSKGTVAFLSDLVSMLSIPGGASPKLQQVSANYNANDGSNGTLINLPSAYPNTCMMAWGNDVGEGALAWGVKIINAGSIRIWGKLGSTYQTGGINLITIGW